MTDDSIVGNVTGVYGTELGDKLTVAAAVGAATLTVADVVDFDEDGGWLRLNGAILEYLSTDDDTATITLAVPLAVAAAVDDLVDVWDAANNSTAVVYKAVIDQIDGFDGKPIEAVVTEAVAASLANTMRDGTGESVTLSDNGAGELSVAQVNGRAFALAALQYLQGGMSTRHDDSEAGVDILGADSGAPGVYLFGIGGVLGAWLDTAGVHLQNNAVTPQMVSFTAHDIGGITSSAGPTPPASPVLGDVWIDTANGNVIKRFDGTSFVSLQDTAIAAASAAASGAQTTANGKNKVTYSTSDPGTTANTAGDVWFTFAGTLVSKQWKGNGGTSWTQVTLTDAVIANLDAAKITTGFLDVARLGADTITVDKLLVGIGHNWIANASFENGTIAPHVAIVPVTFPTTNVRTGKFALGLTPPARGVGSPAYDVTLGGNRFDTAKQLPCKAGDTVYGEVYVRNNTATGASVLVYFDFFDANGALVTGGQLHGTAVTVSSSYQQVTNTQVAPAGSVYVSMSVASANTPGTGSYQIDDAWLSLKIPGSLLVSGTVIADGVVAGAIDSLLITGPTIQTDTAGNRLVIRDDGSEGIIEFFSGVAGETKGQINPSIGVLGQHQITFQTSAGPTSPTNGPGTMILSGKSSGGDPQLGLSLTNLVLDDANTGVGGGLIVQRSGSQTASISRTGAISTSAGITITGANNTLVIAGFPTTTNAANVRMTSGGALQQVTSLSRFKLEQESLSVDAVRGVLNLSPKTWFDAAEVEENGGSTDGLRRIPGLVAEDVAEHAPALALHDADGELQGVAYDRVASLLIPIIRDQQDRIERLEALVADLTAKGDR